MPARALSRLEALARDLDQVADAAVRAMGEVGAAMVYRGDEDFAALDRTAHRGQPSCFDPAGGRAQTRCATREV